MPLTKYECCVPSVPPVALPATLKKWKWQKEKWIAWYQLPVVETHQTHAHDTQLHGQTNKKKVERKNNENMEKKMKKKNITSQQCDDLRVLAIFIHCSGASQFFASTKLIIDFRNSQFHRTRPHKSCGCFSFKIIVIFLGVLAIVVCECIQFLVQIHTTCMPRVWKCCNCKQKSSSRRWFCGNIKMWQMFCGVSCRLTRASSILLNSDWFVVCVCVSASFIETSVVVQFLATTAFYNSFANRWHDNCAAKK